MSNLIKNRLKSENYRNYKKEITCLALSAVFIFLTISLISYSSTDNSLFHFSNKGTGSANWCGFLGANFAALFFYLFGHAAYLLLLCLAGIITLLLKAKNISEVRAKIIAITTFFVANTTLLSILDLKLNLIFSGGVAGNGLSKLFELILGAKGSVLILVTTVWISINWLLEISMIPIIKDLLLVLKTTVTSWIKYLLSKIIKQKNTAPTFRPGASVAKQDDPEVEYWKNLLERGIAAKTTEQQEPGLLEKEPDRISKLIQRFENKKIYKQARKIAFGKAELILLANTVLTKNIFARIGSSCIYEEILNTQTQTNKNSRKEFFIPDYKIFASKPQSPETEQQKEQAKICGKKLEEKLLCLGVKGSVASIKPGPVITMFEYKPEIDSKISKITAVEDDLAMALTAKSIRILAPIPGKNVVGFEISNLNRNDVFFGDVVKSPEFEKNSGKLPLILGVDVVGKPAIEDLSKMPHLLVGGATGSGKSVGLNAMIISLLCKLNPDQLKLILIDPKRLEFGPYADIPHLLFPVVTNATTAIGVLKWVVQEMENRYQKMATVGVRNINEYNALQNTGSLAKPIEDMPFIVVVIDELADLMMVGGKDVETQIVRIAQMARAAGIHMMVATQRPSVEVVTGLIKVNFPSRISFRVSSKIDSRTILDAQGAEKLLGRGDMLYMNSSSPDLMRVHGVYVSDEEIRKVVEWWKAQQEPNYLNLNETLKLVEISNKPQDLDDELYTQVLDFLKTTDEISISLIQRYFRIGFNRSARLIEKLEMDGIVAPAQGSKTRKVIR
ncbi:MAG: DNA translocase FtsK [Candidatus Babeliales bacterium]|jgi:DNA segregation ATPase FtsK/SpoIIIE-like protein